MANCGAVCVERDEFDGMPAWRITSESGASALVAERGASVLSWEPRPGVNVIDGYANAHELSNAVWSRFLVAAPWPGRVKDATYHFDGHEYHLPRLMEGDAIHGFVAHEDFVMEDCNDALTLRCDFSGCEGYPWPFTVKATYSLEAGSAGQEHLSVTICAYNTGSTDIPMALGWHPYMKFPGTSSIADYSLNIPARTKVLFDSDVIPLPGESAYSGVNTPVVFDPLGDVQLDGSYCGLIPNHHGVVVTQLTNRSTGARILLSQEPAQAPIVHVYTGDGAPRDPRGAVALEPLSHLPDAFNRADSAASLRLAPGDTRQLTATITYIG